MNTLKISINIPICTLTRGELSLMDFIHSTRDPCLSTCPRVFSVIINNLLMSNVRRVMCFGQIIELIN